MYQPPSPFVNTPGCMEGSLRGPRQMYARCAPISIHLTRPTTTLSLSRFFGVSFCYVTVSPLFHMPVKPCTHIHAWLSWSNMTRHSSFFISIAEWLIQNNITLHTAGCDTYLRPRVITLCRNYDGGERSTAAGSPHSA